MMPPKKSPAARTSHKSGETIGEEANGKDVIATQQEEKSVEEVEPIPEKNIFTDSLVLEGKRKRCLPPSQEMLNKWLSANFEKSKDAELSTNVNITYDHYVTACIAANNIVPVKVEELRKTLFEMFGSSFVVKDDSAYKGVIRKQKKKKSSATKVRSDTLKMKDVLRTTFTTLGNPKKGLRFRALQQSIAANFPGLKIELHPAVLKRALERGIYSGDLECLRGIGACGYYRLCVDGDDEDDEDAKPNKEKHDGSGEGKELNSEDNSDVESEKKGQTGSGDGDSGKQEEEKAENDKTKKKTKQGKERKPIKHSSKAKKKPNRGRPVKHKLVHSDPQKVEGCLPMAFTYMSEPKTTSIGKIKKYLVHHYNVQREDKIKDAVKYGIESGYWEQVSGSGFSGKLELTVETFNPCDDGDMCGKIMNAIVACSDPKICSAKLLRNYIVTYHSKFNILEKPFLFKHALERAIHRGTIRQLTGIGASGSYQLTIPFTPSPIILAGKDTDDDYASSENEITGDTVDQLELYCDPYKPRPTKRHGLGRQAATSTAPKPASHIRQPPTVRRDPPKHRQLQKPLSPKKKSKAAKSQNGLPRKKSHKRAVPQKRARSPSSSDDDVPEVKGKSSKRAVSQKRATSPSTSVESGPTDKRKSRRQSSHVSVEPNSADSMSDGDLETYTPRPTKSRSPTKSHTPRSVQPGSPKKTPVSRKRNTNGKQQKKVSTDKFASESEDNLLDAGDGESYSPRPTKSRDSSLTPQSTPHKKISLPKRSSSRPVAAVDISGEMSDASGDGKVSVQKKKSAAKKGRKRRR